MWVRQSTSRFQKSMGWNLMSESFTSNFTKELVLICAVVAILKGAWLVVEPLHSHMKPFTAGILLMVLGSVALLYYNQRLATVIE